MQFLDGLCEPLAAWGIVGVDQETTGKILCAQVHAVLAGKARHDDAEHVQLAGGKLEAGQGRGSPVMSWACAGGLVNSISNPTSKVSIPLINEFAKI